MSLMEKLCSELKKYKDVIIYGYAEIGICVLDYIIDFETSIKIANYSGRVKYFATTEQNLNSMRKEKKGIKIKSIYELQEYAKDALVIIATQEHNHLAISKTLDELGFDNRLFISHEMYCVMKAEIEEHKNIVDNRIRQYHLNHQFKLDRIREKVNKKKKIKVFFMTHDAAIFGAQSVYKAMENDPLFEPYILVVSRRDVGYRDFYEDVKKDISFFEERGYRVIDGYDEMKNPKDMHELNPDIIFYDIPKMYGPAGAFYNRLDQLNWEYLTCYIPYGLYMVDSFYYHYHTTCIRETWRFFLDTNADFKRVLADGEFNGFNTVYSGYPKFDEYCGEEGELPLKLQNDKKTIIYAPHHSLGVSNNFATFDLYKDIIFEVAKNNPEYNFVFKPHPLLPFQVKTRYKEGKIDFSYDDYVEYLKKWEALPNGICITQGDYMKLFKNSSCMITDCGSFIGEYFPSGNPCIYMFNPRKKRQADVYTPLAQSILNSYYVVKTEYDLRESIENVILQNMDPKREERERLINAEFGNLGHAGEYICNYLKRIICNE